MEATMPSIARVQKIFSWLVFIAGLFVSTLGLGIIGRLLHTQNLSIFNRLNRLHRDWRFWLCSPGRVFEGAKKSA